MKPLVYYCRWNDAKLRILSREEGVIRGQLRFLYPNEGEKLRDFLFKIDSAELTIFRESGPQTMMLDEMGIPRGE